MARPLLIILLLIAVLSLLPIYPWTSSFGYGPSGIPAGVLVVVLVLLLLGV